MKAIFGLLAAVLAATGVQASIDAAQAASPYGIWLRPKTGGVVRVFRCRGGLGMKVLKSKVPRKVGKVFMCGAKPRGRGQYWGRLKNLDNNKMYDGGARLIGARTLELSGCITNTRLCRSENWRRLK